MVCDTCEWTLTYGAPVHAVKVLPTHTLRFPSQPEGAPGRLWAGPPGRFSQEESLFPSLQLWTGFETQARKSGGQ